jgi:hypothetical protein
LDGFDGGNAGSALNKLSSVELHFNLPILQPINETPGVITATRQADQGVSRRPKACPTQYNTVQSIFSRLLTVVARGQAS